MRRSDRILLAGVGLSALAVVGAWILREQRAAELPSGAIAVPAGEVLDARELHERQMDDLVRAVIDGADPHTEPLVEALAALVRRQPTRFDYVVERLAAADVPPRLALAFAAELPARPASRPALDRVAVPHLLSDDPAAAWAALGVLRGRGYARTRTWGGCACSFGLIPASPDGSRGPLLVAATVDGAGGLVWDPTPADGVDSGWVLGLKRGAEGPPLRVLPLPAGAPEPAVAAGPTGPWVRPRYHEGSVAR